MQSFRTELENPIVAKDIIELERKIRLYREGKIHDEKFRSLRLARGVYGQRQQGVQMIRIKLPYGKMTFKQWLRICDVCDEYSTGNLHLTTRQDIQIHYVSLDKAPELWHKLELDEITLREACGNTVRNITASPTSGIDKNEPFDVVPYADAMFRYFLRNPVCQEMGRKIKIAFSNTDADTSLTFMHDLGFIPKIKVENGVEKRGFKVLLGGGLGAQPSLAKVAFEFLAEDLIIPYTEAVLRVFDRHGERVSRHKARLKFLINKIGFDAFIELVNEEWIAIKNKTYQIDNQSVLQPSAPALISTPMYEIQDQRKYQAWLKTNIVAQKQEGFYAVFARVTTGDIKTDKVRILIEALKNYVADDVRVTINQGLMFKFVRPEYFGYIYSILEFIGIGEAGFDSVADITTCPGTDTCNLGISNSTGITRALEKVIWEEYPDLVYNSDIKIKISGCMNSCGQHGMAHIGFHGSSLKAGGNVLPALQVLLGGGVVGNGEGRVAEKVLKVPSKRGADVLRYVLEDYDQNATEGEYFNTYFDRKGEKYFYTLLKPLADLTNLKGSDFIDWEQEEKFSTAIGVGECAGVVIDLVATLLYESDEKLEWANDAFAKGAYADAIYHTYAIFVNTAKALLLDRSFNANTQHGIIAEFDKQFDTTDFEFSLGNYKETVMQINQNEPNATFAAQYLAEATEFLNAAKAYRAKVKEEVLA